MPSSHRRLEKKNTIVKARLNFRPDFNKDLVPHLCLLFVGKSTTLQDQLERYGFAYFFYDCPDCQSRCQYNREINDEGLIEFRCWICHHLVPINKTLYCGNEDCDTVRKFWLEQDWWNGINYVCDHCGNEYGDD